MPQNKNYFPALDKKNRLFIEELACAKQYSMSRSINFCVMLAKNTYSEVNLVEIRYRKPPTYKVTNATLSKTNCGFIEWLSGTKHISTSKAINLCIYLVRKKYNMEILKGMEIIA